MTVVKKIINGVDVTFIKTKKFKSIYGCLYFKSLVTREKATSMSLLRNVLMRSTKKYNTNQKLNLNVLENYDAYYGASNARYGNYLISSFSFESLEDRYTTKGNLKNVIDTFCEIVFNPNVDNKKFCKKDFDICYDNFMLSLDKIKENQENYSEKRLLSYLNQNKAYSYTSSKEELKKITKESLFDVYLQMMNNSEVSLIVAGNVNENDPVFEKILDNIKSNKKYNDELIINNDDEKGEYKDIIEKGYGTENVLHVISYLKNINDYELNYVMPIYRFILGGSGLSRLFNEVREKNSLAYYCFARLEKDDKMLDIITGFEKENYNEVLSIIKKEINNMKKISNKELEIAKKDLISSLIESKDYLGNLISRNKYEELFNLPNIDEYIKKLKNVTKQEVQDVSYKVDLKLSYFLEGRDNNG